MVRRVDNEAATQWTANIGEAGAGKYSVGYSVIEVILTSDNEDDEWSLVYLGSQCSVCGPGAVAD